MYFELKVFSKGGKTKIQLNAGTPFSTDATRQIFRSEFDPKRARELFTFIADELIPRLVIKHQEEDFQDLCDKKTEIKDYMAQKNSKQKSISAQKLKQAKEDILFLDEKMLKRADRMIAKKRLILNNLTQFNFEELSPGVFADSVQSTVNTNVPPPPPSTRPGSKR